MIVNEESAGCADMPAWGSSCWLMLLLVPWIFAWSAAKKILVRPLEMPT